MWSAVNPAASLALVWLLAVTLVFLLVGRGRISTLISSYKRPLAILVIIALLVRLIPLLLLPVGAGYDIESFRLVGEALLNREEVYTSAAFGRHPYLPLQMYVIGAATALSRITTLPFVIWIKIPALIADLILTGLIYKALALETKTETTAVTGALLYALNPISLLVTSYHGQFDPIPVLLIASAWYSWHFGRRLTRSAIYLGFAILNKTWPIVLLPVLFIRLHNSRQRIFYTAITLSIPILFTAAYVIVYSSDPVPMLRRALTHSGVPGYWGPSAAIILIAGSLFDPDKLIQIALAFQRYLMLFIGLLGLWWTRQQRAIDALLTIILSIFSVMLGMGLQWLLWPIAFAILAGDNKWQKWYSVMGLVMMVVHLYGLHLVPWANLYLEPDTARFLLRISSLPVWLTILFWTISRFRRIKFSTLNTMGG